MVSENKTQYYNSMGLKHTNEKTFAAVTQNTHTYTHIHKYSIKVSTVVLLLLKSKDRAELS